MQDVKSRDLSKGRNHGDCEVAIGPGVTFRILSVRCHVSRGTNKLISHRQEIDHAYNLSRYYRIKTTLPSAGYGGDVSFKLGNASFTMRQRRRGLGHDDFSSDRCFVDA